MRSYKKSNIMLLGVLVFMIGMCIPVHSSAQVLPIWALNPWGSVLGVGNASIPPYTIYNVAASYTPWVPLVPTFPVYNPYYTYGYGFNPSPAFLPSAPVVRSAAATVTLALPTATVVPGLVPVVSAPIISTTQLFLGLLLTIGHESGLFFTNPALFWYLVGVLY